MKELIRNIENLSLNFFRIAILFIVVISLLSAAVIFINSSLKINSTPKISKYDSIEMPEFSPPKPPNESKILSQNKKKPNAKKGTQNYYERQAEKEKEEKKAFYNKYKSSINDISQKISYVLIATHKDQCTHCSQAIVSEKFTDYLLKINDFFATKYYSYRFNGYISGLEDYVDDWADYYEDKYAISGGRSSKFGEDIMLEIDEDFKNYPWGKYTKSYINRLSALDREVSASLSDMKRDRMEGSIEIMYSLWALGIAVSFLLLLIFVKIEHSLRQQAHTLESIRKKNIS